MKGLIVSLFACLVSLVGSAITSHCVRPARHFPVFVGWAAAGAVVYGIAYAVTPADLWFLGPGWQWRPAEFDALYGFVVYCLNCHTWIDLFYATCGGFSSAILLVMRRAGRPISSAEASAAFRGGDHGGGRIYAWRIPKLVANGYLRRHADTDRICLTGKGRAVALVAAFLKRAMTLGQGG